MTLTEKIIKEFDEKKWEHWHSKSLSFERLPDSTKNKIKSFLLSSLHEVATEAIEAVRLEERGTYNYKSSREAIMHNDFDAGYNSAIEDMEQKAKKFLLDNFKIYEKNKEKEVEEMSDMEIYEEMKSSRQWDSRYFELKREKEDRS